MELCPKYFAFLDSHFSFIAENMSPSTFMSKVTTAWQSLIGMATKFVLVEKQNIKAGDMKKIQTVINDNADIIIKRWKEHFEK